MDGPNCACIAVAALASAFWYVAIEPESSTTKRKSTSEFLERKVSHWIAAIEGFELEWLAEMVEDVENRRLRWQAIPGGDVDHELTIELEPATRGRGTLVTITHQLQATEPFRESVRRFAAAITSQRIEADLVRLRQRLEGNLGAELEEPPAQTPGAFEVAEAERVLAPYEDPAARRS